MFPPTPDPTLGGDISRPGILSLSPHVNKHGLQPAHKPLLPLVPRITFQQPLCSDDGSGITFGQAVALPTTCLHLEGAEGGSLSGQCQWQWAMQPRAERGGQFVMTSSCGGSDGGCMACWETAPIQGLVKLFCGVQGYGMSSPNCSGCCLDLGKRRYQKH